MDFLKTKTEELAARCREYSNKGKIVITGHDNPDADSIISAVMMKRLLDAFFVECRIAFCTPPDNVTLRDMRELGVWDDDYLRGFCPDDVLLLVDHHKSFYGNFVIGCVDHHTTPPEPECECAIVYKASSCGKMIFDMMKACNMCTAADEKLALYSVYLDTQSCRSSKFNKIDAPWIDKCIEKYGIDRKEIEKMGFCLNSPSESVDVISMYAYKRYEFNAVSASTAIQIDDDDERWQKIIPATVEFLAEKTEKEGYALWAFVVNKPIKSRSDIYFIKGCGKVEKLELDRLASRSKDVIPVVSAI